MKVEIILDKTTKKPMEKDENYRLKVDSNNTITIKKVKDSYSREEVEELIHKAFKAGYERSHSGYPHTDNWTKPKVEQFIKENL